MRREARLPCCLIDAEAEAQSSEHGASGGAAGWGGGASWALRGCEHPRPVWGSPPPSCVWVSPLGASTPLRGLGPAEPACISESPTPSVALSVHARGWSGFLFQPWVSPCLPLSPSLCFPGSLVSLGSQLAWVSVSLHLRVGLPVSPLPLSSPSLSPGTWSLFLSFSSPLPLPG